MTHAHPSILVVDDDPSVRMLVTDVLETEGYQVHAVEDGFAALEADDLGLKSGEGATLANFRVAGPKQVAIALALLADLREGDVHEQ